MPEESQKQFGDDGEGLEQWGTGPTPQGFDEVTDEEEDEDEDVNAELGEEANLASTAREAREAKAERDRQAAGESVRPEE